MITSKLTQELLDSAIDLDLAALNFIPLEGTAAYDYLLYSDKLERTNPGVLARRHLKRYEHLENGGWWCNGLDPLNNWEPMLWGCLKPNTPRISYEGTPITDEGKLIKYEHPPLTEMRAFFLRVPWKVGLKIAANAGKGEEYEQRLLQAYSSSEGAEAEAETKSAGDASRFGGGRDKNETALQAGTERMDSMASRGWQSTSFEDFCLEEDPGFWGWVCNDPTFAIATTEGAKKAACLLSQGIAAIGLPSHTGGYRTPKNEFGDTLNRHLIPELKPFATLGRQFSICFDRDEKAKTIRSVNNSISRLGTLLKAEGCKVRVIRWTEPPKGVDDFIVALGAEAFEAVYQAAPTLDEWNVKQSFQLTFPASLELNQRYLGALPIPQDADLICIKAPKGTGKTEALIPIVAEAIASSQPVLFIGHRVHLLQDICRRMGIPYITEIRESEGGAALGYGLCFDSLHPKSQARFIASQWADALVIIDEAEQAIWHLLNSATCQRDRVNILFSFKELLQNVVKSYRGRIILADADLSDLSVNYIRELSGNPTLNPWVCVNNWKPEVGWNVNAYRSFNSTGQEIQEPTAWLEALESDICNGGRQFAITSAQKSKSRFGTRNLEAYLKNKYPSKRILRIDSESVAEIGHAAYGCIPKLNEVLPRYDIVICSPSIETGVSIDIKGHFTSVWGCFYGVSSVASELQALARVREPVDRHIWVRNYGLGKVGNGSTSYKSVIASQQKVAKANINLLGKVDLTQDIDSRFDPVSLKTWATMAARINAGINEHRQHVINGLLSEGHQVSVVGSSPSALSDQITKCRDTNHLIECEAIAASKDISHVEYKKSKDKKAKTASERKAERKHELQLRYTEETTIDADLVKKDDDGWHPQIRLHYYLTVGRQHLKARDIQKIEAMKEHTGLPYIWAPDFNKSQLSASIAALENLGILELMNPEIEYRGSDEKLIKLAEIARAQAWNIKAALKISINPKDTEIAIAQKLLGKVGMKLNCVGRFGSRDDRERVYKFCAPDDGRAQVFEAWLKRDEALAESAVSTPKSQSVSTPDKEYIDVTPGHQTSLPNIDMGGGHEATPPLETEPKSPVWVSCGRFGEQFKFRLDRWLDEATAVIVSALTGESYPVPASDLTLWGKVA